MNARTAHSRRFYREYGVDFKTRSPIKAFGDDNLLKTQVLTA